MASKTFAILSGPSCVGKGPLVAALNRFYPDVEYAQVPVIKSRESRPQGPRPEEKEVWNNPDFFRSEQAILALAHDPQYLVGDCRGLPQAVDLKKVQEAEAKLFFVEIYHTIGVQLVQSNFLRDVEVVTVFVSPLGRQEIDDLKAADVDLSAYLTQIMLHKQLVRARYQSKKVDAKDALGRAQDAFLELKSACKYSSHVIVNHDGEGSPNWHRLPSGVFTSMPEGDAGRAVSALIHILSNSGITGVENWKTMPL